MLRRSHVWNYSIRYLPPQTEVSISNFRTEIWRDILLNTNDCFPFQNSTLLLVFPFIPSSWLIIRSTLLGSWQQRLWIAIKDGQGCKFSLISYTQPSSQDSVVDIAIRCPDCTVSRWGAGDKVLVLSPLHTRLHWPWGRSCSMGTGTPTRG
jgi:hypothetical protein